MATRHRYVTLLKRADNEPRKRVWQDNEAHALSIGLKGLNVHCLVCRHYKYPDVMVLVAHDIADKIITVIPPSVTPYRVIVIDMESSIQDQSIDMVRQICDPVILGSPTRAPAA